MENIVVILIPFVIGMAFVLINQNKTAKFIVKLLALTAEEVYKEQGMGVTKMQFVLNVCKKIPIIKNVSDDIIIAAAESFVQNLNNKKEEGGE